MKAMANQNEVCVFKILQTVRIEADIFNPQLGQINAGFAAFFLKNS